ncbi:Arsenate reductase [Roseibacterium elongatum DSM 19469]|uniref:Arsenate reductase n=1 Tax=Roseicyclus elongatus DSM 19469 TaxID=1294273 RepID=W8RWY1_9RHOB|nr:ArsC/Spx/MgsR family protein [Roseibacterium elongatum]AHM05858.1 Arsenate reductase [Roseibacterium elongatum DSM 19469]
MDLTLWHNPRCSKSREAGKLLADRGVAHAIRLYLKEPPSAEEVMGLANRIGRPVSEIVRTKEKAYRALGLAAADDAALAMAISETPVLLERPILDDGRRAVIGRPPEDILTLN